MKKDYKSRVVHRSKIINGQIKALVEAIEKDEYCVDIMTQSLAIQQSLRSLNKLVLENHLNTHVRDGIQHGNAKQQDKIIAELLQIYELTNKRG